MDQFKGVSNPLLEVIVHWLKGVKDIPPSWEFVETILRSPDIGEDELADKIHRRYCDHSEEVKALERKEAMADSGMYKCMTWVYFSGSYSLRVCLL